MSKIQTEKKKKRRKVVFSYEAAGAEKAVLMGDFNNWDPTVHPMKNDGTGRWRKTLLLFPGTYQYKFLVDGNWRMDPLNNQTCMNLFGTKNNVINVSST